MNEKKALAEFGNALREMLGLEPLYETYRTAEKGVRKPCRNEAQRFYQRPHTMSEIGYAQPTRKTQ